MKPKTRHQKASQLATFAIAAIGSMNFLFASPEPAPEGDSEVADFISMDVSSDKRLSKTDVQVRMENGIAVLSGSVQSLAQAERATARANASSGVVAVLNQVKVDDIPSSDIVAKTKTALKAQTMLDWRQITVAVAGNRIVLKGKVGTLDERDLARDIIATVPGVVSIENNLEVTFEGIRSDAQIAEQLRFMIKNDPLCDGLDLTVGVNAGTVSLGGHVGSRAEYDRLVRRSYVTGVTDVQISRLHIESDLAMEGLTDKDYNESQSLEALTAVLNLDSRIDARPIQTKIDKGVVSLKGSVGSIEQRDAVETNARGIPGVLSVTNELKISRNHQMIASRDNNLTAASSPLANAGR